MLVSERIARPRVRPGTGAGRPRREDVALHYRIWNCSRIWMHIRTMVGAGLWERKHHTLKVRRADFGDILVPLNVLASSASVYDYVTIPTETLRVIDLDALRLALLCYRAETKVIDGELCHLVTEKWLTDRDVSWASCRVPHLKALVRGT